MEMARAWERWSGEPVSVVFPVTAQRCTGEAEVLAVQDTTILDHSGTGDSTEGPANLGGGKGRVGVPVHVAFAAFGSGRGLGVLGIDADLHRAVEAPEKEGSGSVRWPDGLDLARRLGRACPGKRAFTVRDCGGEPDLKGTRVIVRRYEVRWTIEEYFKNPEADHAGRGPSPGWAGAAACRRTVNGSAGTLWPIGGPAACRLPILRVVQDLNLRNLTVS